MWAEALILGLLSVGDEYTTHRALAANQQLMQLDYQRAHESGLGTPLRITFHLTFTIGGGYGLDKLEGKPKWILLGVVFLAKSWVIYHNLQVGNEARRLLRDLHRP